ncbi:MAG: exosortase/archaeosortase family protein [Phycisphaerales bacterium]|nr:exosortase/archaeosortase family protein [Phycisphaerales bacterium]
MTTIPANLNGQKRSAMEVSANVAWAAGGLLAALLVVVFWDFFRQQLAFALDQPSDWGHTLVVPLICGYFVWTKRVELLSVEFAPCWWGVAPLILGVGWYMLCVFGPKPLYHHNLFSVGLLLAIIGCCLLLLGTRPLRWLWFPLAYLWFFGQTVSEQLLNLVTFRMQDIAAQGAWILLNGIGVDADREGNVLVIFNGAVAERLNVAEACSGMRMLVAFLALGVAMAYTTLDRPWQRVTLVALGVPVAIFVNVLRVATLGVLSLWDAQFAEGEFHHLIGLIWLIPAFLLYLGAMWTLKKFSTQQPTVVGDGHAS